MFVTCLLAVLEPESGELRFANAGHPLPYQCRSQELRELHARGMPLGLLPEQVYDEGQSHLEPGDSLWLFSDGLVEAHNPQGEMFGLPRLQGLLLGINDVQIDALLADLHTFTGSGWEQEDDITFVTVSRS
jgi:serine phosphatase RsbU (regulator of sigma subunit)